MKKSDVKFEWEIRNLFTTNVGKLSNVVNKIEWICVASYVDGPYPEKEGDPLPTRSVASSRGANELALNTEVFIDYSKLDKDTVLSWVFASIDKDAVEESLYLEVQQRYNAQINVSDSTASSSTQLPW